VSAVIVTLTVVGAALLLGASARLAVYRMTNVDHYAERLLDWCLLAIAADALYDAFTEWSDAVPWLEAVPHLAIVLLALGFVVYAIRPR
jgi:hypothetical protein